MPLVPRTLRPKTRQCCRRLKISQSGPGRPVKLRRPGRRLPSCSLRAFSSAFRRRRAGAGSGDGGRRARQPARRLRSRCRSGQRWRQGSGLHPANPRQHAAALRHQRPRQRRSRRKTSPSSWSPRTFRRSSSPASGWTCRSPRWATPNRCKAACCCKRHCLARTTRCMPWRRDRCPSADSPPAPAAAAAPR